MTIVLLHIFESWKTPVMDPDDKDGEQYKHQRLQCHTHNGDTHNDNAHDHDTR